MSDAYELATPENTRGFGSVAKAAQASFRRNKKKSPESAGAVSDHQRWEFDRKKLSGMKEIGSGNFGQVFLASAKGLGSSKGKTPVAVKTLTSQEKSAKEEFMAEVKIMQSLDGPHNIVRLLAVCTDKQPYYMIMEFAARGDLKGVLKNARPRRSKKPELTLAQLVKMAYDASEGMNYLASMKIVHRDLAARNCLVHQDYRVCIGDFGISRDIYVKEYYKMSAAASLPIRWMAPESLNDGVFSTASDVWSFGILLWEVMTFGMIPYPELEKNAQVVDLVCDEEYRMSKPPGCPSEIYDIMMQCWEEEPEDRPSFGHIHDQLKNLTSTTKAAPIVCEDDQEAAAAAAAEYSLPQDALIRIPPPSEKEDIVDGWDPYGLADIDMNDYGLVDAPTYTTASAGSHYDVASASSASERTYEVASAAPTYDMADSQEKKSVYSKHGMRNEEAKDRVTKWITQVTGEEYSGDFHAWLKDGVVLCKLMEKIKPGSVPKFNTDKSKMKAFHQMENLAKFIAACAQLGVPASDRFDGIDLFQGDNLSQVVNCLNSLNKLAIDKGYLK